MKEVNKMSRLNGELEKAFRLLNQDFFNDELPTPIITVTPTARAYAHYTPWSAWETDKGGQREINISSAYLDRPLENVVASLLHEMVHMYNDCVLHEQDTSRQGTYHNKVFKREAERHGLICEKSEKYGWSTTAPTDDLILWTLDHDEIRDISMCRVTATVTTTGAHSNSGGASATSTGGNSNSHSRKFICPRCKTTLRATRQGEINIVCGDCNVKFVEC